MNTENVRQALRTEKAGSFLRGLYGDGAGGSLARYDGVIDGFERNFGGGEISLFSSPGRTEISGNHTDHNHGRVLAGSINLDCVAAARKNEDGKVRIISETFHQDFSFAADDLEPSSRKAGTVDLTKGLVRGCKERGYAVGGFDAYITSNVISAAGVSSSAAYEMLICAVLNEFYNGGAMDAAACARIGQYAENVYWGKASGLMDQMACAVGGLVAMDFKDPQEPVVEKLAFDFGAQNHSLMIVSTGKGHADLSADYSSIPQEMRRVAEFFGKDVCREITEEQVIGHLAQVRASAGDRAVMRALHFFEEDKRVEAMAAALKEGDFDAFLRGITASGNSSWKWLQNCYTTSDVREQGISVALALTELFIQKKGRGVCRVHGGGFAGVIMAILPDDLAEEYAGYMDGALGAGSVCRMSIRLHGAVCLDRFLF